LLRNDRGVVLLPVVQRRMLRADVVGRPGADAGDVTGVVVVLFRRLVGRFHVVVFLGDDPLGSGREIAIEIGRDEESGAGEREPDGKDEVSSDALHGNVLNVLKPSFMMPAASQRAMAMSA